ncbi:unnamed protein product [Periconia digitata]|uniref:Alpha-L-arabinofuranosidase n=1 Tax=Periconia digitata TaxID=1303443 RepID=A0A9W4XPQ6_9PLEO|nr:unnamed protein product [Periconia digitata]
MSSTRDRILTLVLLTLVSAGPCDIYGSGNTPCVAAHSTTRALYDSYKGNLYQVQRASDSKTQDVAPLKPGGVADAGSQDKFCEGTSCVISIIYDQSGQGNDLRAAPSGGATGNQTGPDRLADATAAPVKVDGQKAYGVFISQGVGYRQDVTKGVVTGDKEEGMYFVVDGTHSNGQCCFDYGNAEVSNNDTGKGSMEALYFGNAPSGKTSGSGPWIAADLEDGVWASIDQPSPSMNSRFVFGALKGSAEKYSLRGADATGGMMQTHYSGTRPDGYVGHMNLTGAIILGIGGDNSNWGVGTFYEGVMVAGSPSDDTENSVQANIVAAKYST